MKIALINGSPKAKDSCCEYLLNTLKLVGLNNQETLWIDTYHLEKANKAIKELSSCDALVIAFPLYVDGLPSHLIRFLENVKQELGEESHQEIRVYGIANCGFYEGIQNRVALKILENWSIRAGLIWGQGLGIGGGPLYAGVADVPLGHGPKKNLGKAITLLNQNIQEGKHVENQYCEPNFFRFLYILCAHIGWKQSAKVNGISKKDLYRKL